MASYRLTSAYLPGLAKLGEECSEVSQSVAKIIGGCDSPDQLAHLEEEMGDAYAALRFFIDNNPDISWERVANRANEKEMRWNAKRVRSLAQNG